MMDKIQDGNLLAKYLFKVNVVALFFAFLFLPFDQTISQIFSWEKTYKIYFLARHTTDLALPQYYLIPTFMVFIYFSWLASSTNYFKIDLGKIEFYKKWSLNFIVALLISGIWVHIIKFIVGRQRPHISGPLNEPFIFSPFNFDVHFSSFPSGHAQVMFTFATMMTLAFPKKKWLWILLASYICFTRVIVHDHFLSDTIFGACTGYTATLFSLYLMRKTSFGLFQIAEITSKNFSN